MRGYFALGIIGIWSMVGLAAQAGESLHDKAKKAGGKYVWVHRPDRSTRYPNIEELAKRSDLVVIGRALAHRSSLSADGKFITRDFWVKVYSVMAGDIAPGSTILVSLPGGGYRFPDDTYAYIHVEGFKQAEDGKLYVFFLRKKGPLYKGYELEGGVQGLFEITSGRVEPADLFRVDPIVIKYRGKEAREFLAEIRRSLPKKGGRK